MDAKLEVTEAQGMFSKRSNSNILSDPRILQHLRIVAQESHRANISESEETDLDNQRRELYDKITAYNKRNQLGAFKILSRENLNYEGALRFYFLDQGKELTKAVKLTNKTTVKELLPSLVDKFRPGLQKEFLAISKLYAVLEEEEICLVDSEWPLAIALNSTKPIRFVLRIDKKNPSVTINGSDYIDGIVEQSKPNTKSLLRVNGGTLGKPERPLSGGNFMYAGRNRSIKMTAGATYEKKSKNPSKPKKAQGSRTKGKSIGAVLKLPKKNRALERGEELSSDVTVPGVLKVFGTGISADSNYKSVKVTSKSNADLVIKQTLTKYKLNAEEWKNYELYDVVGNFRNASGGSGKGKDSKMQWVTEYARVVGENEKPLLLQMLWKPPASRSRRFEIRLRGGEEDYKSTLVATSNGATEHKHTTIVNQPPGSNLLQTKLSLSSTSECSESGVYDSPMSGSRHDDDGSVSQSNLTFNMSSAVDVPYLLLLRGSGIAEDYLLHRLEDDHMIIGRPTIGQKHPDIPLYSDDVQTQHCKVYKKLPGDNESVAESEDGLDMVFLQPFPNCDVIVNGRPVIDYVMLAPGDLLQIGANYVFLYKDPIRLSDANLVFDWLPGSTMVDGQDMTRDRAKLVRMPAVTQNPNRLSLAYDLEDEDKLLEYFVTMCEPVRENDFELVASYLFILAIEYSAFHHNDIDTRRLILKITNVIQGVAWDKTKGITETNVEGEIDPLKSLDEIIPDLKQILFWMSNALEMLHYLQDNLSTYLPNAFHVNSRSNDPEEEALANADEELLNVLEEVAMFTFQQTVYHLTKVLYVALPLILDTNPFQLEDDDSRNGDALEGAEIVVQIFQTVYNLIISFNVHEQIIRQLFAYLFFFTNASLFNTLMDRGSGGKFYRWAKGAQIRGNLDMLESWASEVGLQEEATDYLRKLSSAADVLATPKVQLLQADWKTLRHDFPVLNAAQLHKILTEYQMGTGKHRPAEWRPTSDEVDAALRDEEILESFSTHPPFLFPTSDYVLDLVSETPNPQVQKALDNLRSTFGPGKDPEVTTSTPRNPQVLIHAPESGNPSRRSTPNSSVRSSPPTSVVESPKKMAQTFSSSDPTLHRVDPSKLSKHFKNHVGNGISRSASFENVYTPKKTSLKGKRVERIRRQESDAQSRVNQSVDADDEYYRRGSDTQDDVFVVELEKGDSGIGVGLIDGLYTPLKSNGIYVRTLVSTGPAAQDGRLKLGDRILAVNGTSLVGADYQSAMQLIRNAGNHLTFLVAKSDDHVVMKITSSTC